MQGGGIEEEESTTPLIFVATPRLYQQLWLAIRPRERERAREGKRKREGVREGVQGGNEGGDR